MPDHPELTELLARRARLEAELRDVASEIARRKSPAPVAPPPLPPTSGGAIDSTELRLGRVWTVRIGIVLLVTGLVLFGNIALREFVAHAGAAAKLLAIAAAGGLLLGLGAFLRQRAASLAGYARVLSAGGFAVLYYCAYAAHFVPTLRIIPSPLAAGILLLAVAFWILWVADRSRSQALAGTTILLGFYTTVINPAAGVPVVGSLVLAVSAVVLLVRRRWAVLPVVGVLACYAGFFYWRIFGADSLPLGPTIVICGLYWAVFQIGILAGTRRGAGGLPLLALVNNGGVVAATLPWVVATHPDHAWVYVLVCGGVFAVLGILTGRGSTVAGVNLAQGLALVSAAALMRFSGFHAAIFFAIAAMGALRASRFAHPGVLRVFSGAALLLGAVRAAWDVLDGVPAAPAAAAWVAVAAGVCGWLFKSPRAEPPAFRWPSAACFSVSAALVAVVSFHHAGFPGVVYILCAAAVLAVLAGRFLRLPELAAVFQALPLLAGLRWAFAGDEAMRLVGPAGGLLAALIVGCVGVRPRRVLDWLNPLAAALVVVGWALARFDVPFAAFAAALGVPVFALAGRWHGAHPLAWAAEGLAWFVMVAVALAVFDGRPWAWSAAALAVVSLRFALPTRPESIPPRGWREAGLGAVGFLVLVMLHSYLPDGAKLPATTVLAAGALILWNLRGGVAALGTGVLGAVGGPLAFFFWPDGSAPGDFAPFLSGALLFVAAAVCERGRHRGVGWIPAVAASLLVWTAWRDWLEGVGVPVTVAAALLGFVLLAGGLLFRRRVLRLPALGVLALAVLRVFAVDVWALPPALRIVSFLVLGAVLLVLGFFYNRYAEKLRRWL